MILRTRLIVALLFLAFCAFGTDLSKQAKASLKKGVAFFYTLNTQGGYVYHVTPDLSLR